MNFLGMSLGQIAVLIGADTTPMKQQMAAAVPEAARLGNAVGSSFALGFRSPFLNAVGSVHQLTAGMRETVQLGAELTGMRVAADMGRFRRQLEGISGDSRKAGRAFSEFQRIAGETNFDTDQVFSFGIKIAGKTGDVGAAVTDLQKIVDSAQATGVHAATFADYQRNLGQIQNMGDRKVEIPDREQLKNYAPLLSTAVGKALGISTAEASKKIDRATGNELYNMILAVGAKNAGAAKDAAAQNPFDIGRNILDSARQGMAPTGDLLNGVATPVMGQVKKLTDSFGDLNRATGGGAGLTAITVGATFAVVKFVGAATAAKMATDNAAASLTRLTIAAERLAMVPAPVGGGVAGRGGVLVGTGAPLPVSGVTPVPGGVPKGGMGHAFSLIGKGLSIGKAILSFGLPLIGSMGLSYLGGKTSAGGNKAFGGWLTGAGQGLGLGALIGSIIPGVGTALGAGIGAIIGGTIGGIRGLREQRAAASAASGKNKEDENTKALRENTNAVRDMSNKVLGGGARAKGMASQLEWEYALLRI